MRSTSPSRSCFSSSPSRTSSRASGWSRAPAAMPAGASAERAAHARHRRAGVGPRERVKKMTIDYVVGLVVTVGLLVYLTYALLRPEKF